jgi:hypothetical protein
MSDPELVIQESAAARALPAAASGRHADAVPVMVLGWMALAAGRRHRAIPRCARRRVRAIGWQSVAEHHGGRDRGLGRPGRGRRAHGHHVGPSVVDSSALLCVARSRPPPPGASRQQS